MIQEKKEETNILIEKWGKTLVYRERNDKTPNQP